MPPSADGAASSSDWPPASPSPVVCTGAGGFEMSPGVGGLLMSPAKAEPQRANTRTETQRDFRIFFSFMRVETRLTVVSAEVAAVFTHPPVFWRTHRKG